MSHKQAGWTWEVKPDSSGVYTHEQAALCVLMDVRAELQAIRARLDCPETRANPGDAALDPARALSVNQESRVMSRAATALARWQANRKRWAAAFWRRWLRRQLADLDALERRWRMEAEEGRRPPKSIGRVIPLRRKARAP